MITRFGKYVKTHLLNKRKPPILPVPNPIANRAVQQNSPGRDTISRMFRARTLLFLFLLSPWPVFDGLAQSAPGTTIVLPPKLLAGQQATLAVLDSAGRLVPAAVVEFSGGEKVTTDATGRALFTAPAEPGVLLVRLTGRSARTSAAVVAPAANPPDGVQILDSPSVAAVDDRFVVEGTGFRGDANSLQAAIGGQPALVLASSPLSLVLLPNPRVKPGLAQLVIEVGGRSPGPVPITLVSLDILSLENALKPGEKGVLTVRVRGTDQRLVIEARNLTPEVVSLVRGNVLRVTSSGGAINDALIEIQAGRSGDFSITVRLVPGVSGLPDVEAARQKLMVARQMAPEEWQERISRLIRRIERDPQDALKVRDELEKMLAENPPGELGRQLEAAWRVLIKR